MSEELSRDLRPEEWSAVAHNQASDSENRIHSDEVAKRYGFRGGLVPGVTVYAYLVHPAVRAWGLEWLTHGTSEVVLRKPLYDADSFRVEVRTEVEAETEGAAYHGRVIASDGTVCAEGRVSRAGGDVPGGEQPGIARRFDAQAPASGERPVASRAALESLRERGMGSLSLEWDAVGAYDRYVLALDDVPPLVRPDGERYANAAFALGLANAALASNVQLGPWIHVQSDVRNHAPIPAGAKLAVESTVVDLFARGGHEFVDLDVAVFLEPGELALTTRHRAIYVLRPA